MAFLAIEETNIITDQSSLLALKVHITHDPNNFLAKKTGLLLPLFATGYALHVILKTTES